MNLNRYQSGVTTAEFAMVGLLFLTLVFGILEFARAFFVWNTLTEATRRGARVAVVCPVADEKIAQITVFNAPGTSGDSAIIAGLSSSDVKVEYLDINGGPLCSGTSGCAGTVFTEIRYVRVGINGYRHELLLPPFNITLAAPAFETTLPRESLGIVPDVATPQC